MPLLTLSDLITPDTRQQIEDVLLQIATTLGLPARSWQPLGVARTVIATVSTKLADFTTLISEITKGGFLDLGSADWQELKAQDDYNVAKIHALAATGIVTLTNPTAIVYTFSAGDLHVANTTTGKTYANTNTAPLTLNGSSTLDISIGADEVGTSSNAGPGGVTTVVSPAMPGVTCNNAESVLGADDETTAQLAARCRQKLASLSPNGPGDAYSYVAKTTTGVTAPITRTNVTLDTSTGIVTIYIANANGSPPAGDVAIVDTAIQTKAVPVTVTATTVAASNHTLNYTVQVWLSSLSGTVAQVQAAVSAAISAYLASLDVGGSKIPGVTQGYVYVDEVSAEIRGSYPGVVRVAIVETDTAIAINEVAVLGAAAVTVTS